MAKITLAVEDVDNAVQIEFHMENRDLDENGQVIVTPALELVEDIIAEVVSHRDVLSIGPTDE